MRTLKQIVKEAGGQSEIARQLGLRQQSISEWVERNRVPAERVIEVERITGVPRHELRPDIYPRDEYHAA